MQDLPPAMVTPFVFSDPAGKRWPRLRLVLVISSVLFFLGAVLFVQTLFVAPQMRVPFSLRQLKGQLKSLQKQNPAGQMSPNSLLWQKFGATRQAAKKVGALTPTVPAKPRKKAPNNEVRLAFYTNGDPYSYTSLEQHAALITHLCPEWMAVVNGVGDLQIDADNRLPKLAANKGIALMPLLTNLIGDTWQPEAVENLAHGPAERQDKFIHRVVSIRLTKRTSLHSSTSLPTRCITMTKNFGCVFSLGRSWITSISIIFPIMSIVSSRFCLMRLRTSTRPVLSVHVPGLKGGCTSCWRMRIPSNGSLRSEATAMTGRKEQRRRS